MFISIIIIPNDWNKLIMNLRVVSVSYNSSMEYFDDKYNSHYCNDSITIDHSISIIGWHDNFSKSKFNRKPMKNRTSKKGWNWLIQLHPYFILILSSLSSH